jgi:hypothetical protein
MIVAVHRTGVPSAASEAVVATWEAALADLPPDADHRAIARWLNESLPGVRDGSDFVVWVEQRRQWRGEGAPVSISSAQVDDGAGGRRRQPVDFYRGVVRYQMRPRPPDQWYQGEKMRREKDLIAMVTAIR